MRKAFNLFLILVLVSLVVIVPASAASPVAAEQTCYGPSCPLKTVKVGVYMLACTVITPNPTGCIPLNNAFWQWRPVGNPYWMSATTNPSGWGLDEFWPDYRWNGWIECKGYNWPDGRLNITKVYVSGTYDVQVACPNLYSK